MLRPIRGFRPVLAAVPAGKGVLLDGFPRAIDQHELFERLIGKARAVLWYELPQEVMEVRLLKRSEASGRADDKADVIRKRFATFVYGNFDISFDHFSRISQLHTTPSAPRAMLYFVPVLIGG